MKVGLADAWQQFGAYAYRFQHIPERIRDHPALSKFEVGDLNSLSTRQFDSIWCDSSLLPMKRLYLTDKQRAKFLGLLKPVGDCLEWQGTIRKDDGRGQIMFNNVLYKAHRVAYYLDTGKDPGELLVCHTCDNPPCCRASHLFLGTCLDNIRDCVRKGRFRGGGPTGPNWNAKPLRGCDNPGSTLDEHDVELIRTADESGRVLAARFKVSTMTISRIRRGLSYRNVGSLKGPIS